MTFEPHRFVSAKRKLIDLHASYINKYRVVYTYTFTINHRPSLVLVQFSDLPCYHPGILLASICRRDSCPFDRKFYRLAFAVYYHLRIVVADPECMAHSHSLHSVSISILFVHSCVYKCGVGEKPKKICVYKISRKATHH